MPLLLPGANRPTRHAQGANARFTARSITYSTPGAGLAARGERRLMWSEGRRRGRHPGAALASSKGGSRGDQEREAEPAGDRISVPDVVGPDAGRRAAAALPGVRPAGPRPRADDAA